METTGSYLQQREMMRKVWLCGQLVFLALSIVCVILQNGMSNEYLIMSFEMAILYELEDE